MRRFVAALAVPLVTVAPLAACDPGSSSEPDGEPTPSSAPESCGEDYLEDLDDRDRLAQLLMVGVRGSEDAITVVREHHIGGVFIGGWTDVSFLDDGPIGAMQAASRIPVMVAIDEEGGRVSRVAGLFGAIPSARESARTMSPHEVRALGRERGEQLAGLGITVDFAPVVDVSEQPDGGVIGDRSYSDDPQTVTEYATAFAAGLDEAGVLPVIKHFPGHGRASGDSHSGLATTPPLESLREDEFLPYEQMIGTLPLGVMTGHLEVPGLTPAGEPASLSPQVIDVLRSGDGGRWAGHDGVVFTDDLSGMKAITDRHPVPEAVELALAAGNDIALWLTTDEVPEVLDHLQAALNSGDLDAEQINRSVLRVAEAKGLLDCDPSSP
ncbi:beta-glucosidase [Aeromicrobium sp. PE09-221]|nr:beta-glucosidase [Aeromicrobium sp. PE09-221]